MIKELTLGGGPRKPVDPKYRAWYEKNVRFSSFFDRHTPSRHKVNR